MDGSRVDSFLPTSYTYRTDPKEINQVWKNRTQIQDLDAFLLPFGYGDGGGGRPGITWNMHCARRTWRAA